VATLTLSSIAILIARKETGENNTPEKALWWCLTTITTVGYGDLYPETSIGKIVAAITMVMGIAIFSSLTALITSLVIESTESWPTAKGDDWVCHSANNQSWAAEALEHGG
jgi:voltage-gated potassium channel